MALILSLIALFAWIQWLMNTQLHPLWFTAAAVICGIVAVRRWNRTRRLLANYKLGLKGERYVGQFLQSQLIPMGYHILHDIEFDGFNIDHVAIGPGGVFVVEVKTYSKRPGDVRISYDGNDILVDGQKPIRDPLAQVRASTRQLVDLLEKKTGRTVKAHPVVLFPGWYVEKMPPGVDTWVLPETAFVKFIQKQTRQLSDGDAKVLFEGLAQYVRDRLTKEGYTT